MNFGGGYATHAGDWFLGWDDGLNDQGGFSVMIGPRNYLHANYRHPDFGRQILYFDEYSPTIAIETFLREYQFFLGRHAPLVNKNGVRSVGYLEVGISVMDHHVRVAHQTNTGSPTKMGLALQAGALALLTDVLALDVSAGGTWKPGTSDSESGGLLISGHLGLRILYSAYEVIWGAISPTSADIKKYGVIFLTLTDKE